MPFYTCPYCGTTRTFKQKPTMRSVCPQCNLSQENAIRMKKAMEDIVKPPIGFKFKVSRMMLKK